MCSDTSSYSISIIAFDSPGPFPRLQILVSIFPVCEFITKTEQLPLDKRRILSLALIIFFH